MRETASASAEGRDDAGHIVPVRVLFSVLGALLALTWVTVAATGFDVSGFGLWLALGIATLKASLVVLYFMHLRYDSPINAIVFIAALLFVALFVGLTLVDTRAYRPDQIPGYAPAMQLPR